MSWARLILLVFVGFTLHGEYCLCFVTHIQSVASASTVCFGGFTHLARTLKSPGWCKVGVMAQERRGITSHWRSMPRDAFLVTNCPSKQI